MAPATVYLETTVLSYLTARDARDEIIAAHQSVTRTNLRHLAGAVARRRIEHELRRLGYEPPTICTPEELMS